MKTLIQLVVVALIVGGISAAATILTQKQAASAIAGADDQPPAGTAATAPHEPAAESDAKPDESKLAADDSKAGVTAEKRLVTPQVDENPLAAAEPPRGPQAIPKRPAPLETFPADAGKDVPGTSETRVAVRPPYAPEGDEAGALINLLRDRAKLATETERRLAERQDAMKLIFEDLRAEQTQTLKLRHRLASELKESREAVDAEFQIVETERASIKKDIEDARRAADQAVRAATEERDKLRKQLDRANSPAEANSQTDNSGGSPEDNANIKKMAAVFDGMPAENVAKVFEQLVKNKRIDSVVSLMNAMKDRQTAKVLATITDTNSELAADLTDRLKRLKAAIAKPAAE